MGCQEFFKRFVNSKKEIKEMAQDLFLRYQNYWTNGFGETGDYVWMAESFLNWFQTRVNVLGIKFITHEDAFSWHKKTVKMIQDFGNFIIKEWWFNNKKFKTPGDEYVLKIITILFPAMIFQENTQSCAVITTRFIGKDQLKVDIEHDPRDCYEGNGVHSSDYYDERDEIWGLDCDYSKND